MAKVLIVLLQFNDLQAQQILEKHKLSKVCISVSHALGGWAILNREDSNPICLVYTE